MLKLLIKIHNDCKVLFTYFYSKCVSGSLCGKFKAFMLQTIEVLTGSCVTIPCSFDVRAHYESNLDNTLIRRWTWSNLTPRTWSNLTPRTWSNLTPRTWSNLTSRSCNTYIFRVECDNRLKYYFGEQISNSVTAAPPRPTLTPSAVKVEEGTSVSLTCSAPAPCPSHPPTLTWTNDLGPSVETLQENQDQTKVMTSVVTFNVSHKWKHRLSCYSPANPPVDNYTWYRRADGGQETFIGTGAVLNIKASKDYIPLFCKAENNIGVGQSNRSHILHFLTHFIESQ
uniref:Ig-like domain-containing protein n=1 Tax=Cyclopterus lumpus TaxID=8103 RepID=A0A8C3G470_CYCLU